MRRYPFKANSNLLAADFFLLYACSALSLGTECASPGATYLYIVYMYSVHLVPKQFDIKYTGVDPNLLKSVSKFSGGPQPFEIWFNIQGCTPTCWNLVQYSGVDHNWPQPFKIWFNIQGCTTTIWNMVQYSGVHHNHLKNGSIFRGGPQPVEIWLSIWKTGPDGF